MNFHVWDFVTQRGTGMSGNTLMVEPDTSKRQTSQVRQIAKEN